MEIKAKEGYTEMQIVVRLSPLTLSRLKSYSSGKTTRMRPLLPSRSKVMFIWLKKAIAPTIVLSIEFRSINKYLISAYYIDHINVFPIKTTKVSSK